MMGAVWRLAQDRGGSFLNVLEVGSWVGVSALTFGKALAYHNGGKGHITCVDAWSPYVDLAANDSPMYVEVNGALRSGRIFDAFHRNMEHLPACVGHTVIRGWSAKVLPTLQPGAYDLVNLDGDHAYTAVRADIDNAIPLVSDGGILCGDDLELQADEAPAEIARTHTSLDCIYSGRRRCFYHPGVSLAVGEVFGHVSAWAGFWAMQKRGNAWAPVSLAQMPLFLPPFAPPEMLLQIKQRFAALAEAPTSMPSS